MASTLANKVISNTNEVRLNMKLDSGATKHFFRKDYLRFLSNIKCLRNGPTATLPKRHIVQVTHEGTLKIKNNLTPAALRALIFPNLTNESLVSIGQLCDDGCIVLFTKTHAYICKSISNDIKNMNYIIRKNKTQHDLAAYYHASLFSPAISTLTKAIKKGKFISWPGINELNFKKPLNTTIATELGHLNQERKNLRSTKFENTRLEKDTFPIKADTKTQDIFDQYLYMQDNAFFNKNRKLYSDQTGKFPYQSSRGNNYIMVMYDDDSNGIMVEPFKIRQGKELATMFAKLCEKFKIHKSETNIFISDNKCSKSVKDTIKSFKATYQLAPPLQHRQNAAENAIKTFKAHLLSGLATCNKDFPIAEWDRLLPQAELTLNLLQNARVNTRLSSWAFLNGNHDFNRHPIAPPGTKIIIHLKPLNRPSWGFHGRMG